MYMRPQKVVRCKDPKIDRLVSNSCNKRDAYPEHLRALVGVPLLVPANRLPGSSVLEALRVAPAERSVHLQHLPLRSEVAARLERLHDLVYLQGVNYLGDDVRVREVDVGVDEGDVPREGRQPLHADVHQVLLLPQLCLVPHLHFHVVLLLMPLPSDLVRPVPQRALDYQQVRLEILSDVIPELAE